MARYCRPQPDLALPGAAVLGLEASVRVEAKVVSPLIRLALFKHPGLGAGFAMSALAATVVAARRLPAAVGAIGRPSGHTPAVWSHADSQRARPPIQTLRPLL